MGIILYLIIGIVAGYLAGKMYKGKSFGLIGNLLVGMVGGFLGGIVFGLLGFGGGNLIGALISATWVP